MKRLGVAVFAVGLAWAAWWLGGVEERAWVVGDLEESVDERDYAHAHDYAHPHAHADEEGLNQRAVPRVETLVDAHPHPISAEHRFLQRERQLIAALNDALDNRDAPALRELVARYAEHDPQDTHALQQGYALVADCLEHPGPDATHAAQVYYDRERASVLRRYIRRTCLE